MMPEITNLAIALLLAAIAIIQVFAIWILNGVRSSIRELWVVSDKITTTLHEIDKRITVAEHGLERRTEDDGTRRRDSDSQKRR